LFSLFFLQVAVIILQADTDGNGSIDYMEFVTATLQMGEKDDESQLLSAFKYFDKDNSGYAIHTAVLQFDMA
jgi:calcium-dependent protein kinase